MRQSRWRKATEWPLTAVALIFLVAYSWEVIGDLHGDAERAAEIVIWATWSLFVVDYIVNLIVAERRARWFFTHLLDLAIVALPILRPLRLLRLATLFSVLQRSASAAFRGRVILYVVAAAGLLVYIAALGELDAERGHGGPIQHFGQGLWWAFVSVTTVGYGDYYPVTAEGKLIAVGVMIGGIALIGVVTATLASWIVDRVAAERNRAEVVTTHHVEALMTEVRELRTLIERQGAPSTAPDQAEGRANQTIVSP